MKKTKKALLAALACSAVLAGAFGLAACNKNDNGGNGGENDTHTHSWSSWTVTDANKPTDSAAGKATRTCSGTGDCDAEAAEKEHELPALSSSDYSKTEKKAANCTEGGTDTYTYNKDGVNVKFDVATAVDPEAHDYDYVSDGAEGHHGVCDHNPEHVTDTVEHDDKGENGSCSVCGYIAVELNKEITVSGATIAKPKRFDAVLEAGEYEIIVDGVSFDTTDRSHNLKLAFGTLDNGELTPVDTNSQRVLKLETAGTYCVEVYADLTFKIALASEHVHTFNTEKWEYDETGHWHPATCVHTTEKDGYAQHTLGEPSEPDEDGKTFKGCVCGYKEVNYNATKVTGATGDWDDGTPLTVSETGNYAADIKLNSYNYPAAQRFNLTNDTDATKKFTVKVIGDDTKVTLTDFANSIYYDPINEVGDSISFLLDAGAFIELTADTNGNAANTVIFRVIVEEAPADGDFLKPIVVEEMGKKTVTVEAGQAVYFQIPGYISEASGFTVTFGTGINATNLGNNKNNEGTLLLSGGNIARNNYGSTYLCLTAVAAGEMEVTFEEYWAPGTKVNPYDIQVGAGKTNSVHIDSWEGVYDEWFKFTATEAKKYILKVAGNAEVTAQFNLFNNPDDMSPVTSTSGVLVVDFTDGAGTVYIKASESNNIAYEFTVTEFNPETDIGFSSSDPIVLTESATLDILDGEIYYVYNAPASTNAGLISLVYNGGVQDYYNNMMLYVYSDAAYTKRIAYVSNKNRLNINREANAEATSYYIKAVKTSNTLNETFEFILGEYAAHDYVVTVTDGDLTDPALPDGVTVTLTHEDESLTAVTVNGVATFNNVDPSIDYRVSLSGLPEGFGYYPADTGKLTIASNVDNETNFTVTIYQYHTYTVTFKLPEGAGDVDLSGIEITAEADNTGAFTATTDVQGVATISALSPYGNGNFVVTVTKLPDSLKDAYAYAPELNGRGDPIPLTLTDENNAIEAKLAATVSYTLTLKDGDGNTLPAGITVTVNGIEGTTDANGQVTIKTSAGKYSIAISGNWITETTTTADSLTLDVICSIAITGSSSADSAPELPIGTTTFIGSTRGVRYGKIVASKAGTYSLSYAEAMYDGGFTSVTLNGTLLADMMNDNVLQGSLEGNIGMWYIYSFTIDLSEGDVLVLGISGNYGSGTITVSEGEGGDETSNTVTVGTPVSVTGASYFTPKQYVITLEAGDYQFYVNGQIIELNMAADVVIGNTFDGNDLVPLDTKAGSGDKVVTVEAGKYYIAVYADVTFAIVAEGAEDPGTGSGEDTNTGVELDAATKSAQGMATWDGTPLVLKGFEVGKTYTISFIMGAGEAYVSNEGSIVTEFTYSEGLQLSVCALNGDVEFMIFVAEKTAEEA